MNRKTIFLRWLMLFVAGLFVLNTTAFAQTVEPRLEVTPSVLDLGDRPINSWTEPGYFTLTNLGTESLVVNNVELDAPDFFSVVGDFPVTLAGGESIQVGVSASGVAIPGMLSGEFVAQWGANRAVVVTDFMANAYDPREGDVVENAFDDALPFSKTFNTGPFYLNYDIDGAGAADKDAVYTFTLAEDQLVSASLTVNNGTPKMTFYSAPFGLNEGPGVAAELYTFEGPTGPGSNLTANDVELAAGTYYLVFSGRGMDINVSAVDMPAPEAATYVTPMDGAVDVINGDELTWTFGANTVQYQLLLGTTYPPASIVVDWTSDLETVYELVNTQPNLQYFWQVNTSNSTGGITAGPIWGFTTTLTPPSALTADAEIYEGEDVVLTWESPVNRALIGYNIFRDGVQLNADMLTEATYTDETPAYNMTGYDYTVSSIFDEGESAVSDVFTVQVTGEGTLSGNVSDQVTGLDIEGAVITIEGEDEFAVAQSYEATTDASGNYTLDLLAGMYDLTVVKDGYITATLEDVVVTYDATTTEDIILLETAYPVAVVTASEFGENILIEWSFDATTFAPQVMPFDTKGMSDEHVQKMWSEFMAENNFDATAQGSDRALVEFEIWREREYLPGTMEMIGTTSQYQFVDFDWGVQEWGVYKWYVKAVYDENESEAVASNTLDKDMTTVVDVTVALNSADSPGGTVVTFTNLSEPALNLEYGIVLGASGEYEWDTFRKGTYDIEIIKGGFAAVNEANVDIFEATSFEWLLEELLAVPAELYVTPTGFATWEAGVAETFEPMMQDFNDGLGEWTVEQTNVEDTWFVRENEFSNIDGTPYAYVSYDTNPQDELLISPVMNTTAVSTLFVQFEQYYNDYSGDTDMGTVEVYDGSDWVVVATYEGEDFGTWATPDFENIDVTAYKNDNFQVRFHYIGSNDWYWAVDNVLVTNVPAPTREFATYKIFLDEVLLGELTEEEYQLGTTFGETLTAGETYLVEVAAVYTTGQSDRAAASFIYVPCEDYAAPADFAAAQLVGTLDIELTWTNVDAAALDTVAGVVISRNGEEYAAIDFEDGAVASFLDEELEFGTYNYCITYIYDSGAETCQGATCTEDVVITGGGYVNGTVTAFDGGAAIEGASILVFNDDYSFEFTTDVDGFYTGEVVEGTYEYLVSADAFESQMLEGVEITFGETVTNDFILLEFPYAVGEVIATEISDAVVQVDWSGTGGGGGGTGEDFFEGFEDGTLPTGWVTYDQDGDTYNWENTAVEFDIFEAHTGLYCMASASYRNDVGALTPNNWLVTPAIDATDASMLSFWVSAQDPDWSDEQYYVKVSTTGNEVADFTETVHTAVSPATWGEVTVDLSAYAGETIYIAFQHADVTDMFFLKLDDVAVTNTPTRAATTAPVLAGNSTAVPFKTAGMNAEAIDAKMATIEANSSRELLGYSVYRTTCETGDLQFLGYTLDEQFTDNTWGAATSGVYKWGVVAEYDNNESEVVFSNCLDKDMITMVSVTVSTNSGDSPEETDVLFTNISEPGLELTYEVELDETGFFAWDEFRKGVYNITVAKAGFELIEEMDVEILDATDFEWILIELLAPVEDLYVTPTAFATWRKGGEVPFEAFAENFDEGMPETWTVVVGGSTPDSWYVETPAGNPQTAGASLDGTPFAYVDSDEAGIGATMDEMLISPAIDASNADQLFLHFDQYYNNIGSDYAAVDVFDGSEWVNVLHQSADAGAWDAPAHQVIDVTEYVNEAFQVRFHYVSGWSWYWAVDNVTITEIEERGSRALQYYKVWLDGIFITDTEETFYQYATENLVEGQEYFSEVAAVYSNGISEKMNYTWTYYSCENYPGVEDLAAEVNGQDVTLTWGGTTPPPPPSGDGIEEDFETGSLGADWVVEQTNTATGGPVPAYWTVNNYISADFSPFGTYHAGLWWEYSAQDEWLITPEFTCDADASLEFWSAVYEGSVNGDHYYVKVSADGGSTWTALWDASALTGNAWNYYDTPYTVDLAAYAGDDIQLAFNAVDGDGQGLWYIWFIDNITVGSPTRSLTFDAASLVRNSNAPASVDMIARDGNTARIERNVATNFDPAMAALMVDSKAFTGETAMNREVGVLWGDNWEDPQTTTDGIISTYYGGLDAPTYSADDFTVPAGEEWVVSSLWARGFVSAGVPNPDGFGYTVFADENGAPGAVLYEEINTGANDPAQVEIDLASPITLAEGTYWVSFYAYYEDASAPADGRWNQYMWNPATTPGNPAMLDDVAGLFGGTGGFVTLTSLGVDFSSLDFAVVGESQEAGGGGGGFETGELLGANVYRDGILIAEMVTDDFYVDEEVEFGQYTYCVTYVYESGAESCFGECVDVDLNVTCDAPKELAGDYLWTEEAWGAMIEWNSPVDVVAEWLFYDDGVNVDGIGGPATFTWAIKFDPAQLADYDGASLTKIEIYNRTAATDELRIYEGTNAATLLHSQPLSGLAVEEWAEVNLTSPVLIDVTKQLWIGVYSTDGVNFPAAVSDYSGDPNGDLITTDGVVWEHINDLGVSGTWNLRGYVTTVAGATASIPMNKPADDYTNVGAKVAASGKPSSQKVGPASTMEKSNRELAVFNVYRSLDNENYEFIAEVPFEEGVSSFGYFDTDVEAQTDYYYQVTAFYNLPNTTCESEPAMALENPEDDYVAIFVTNVNELGAATARLYPNPATENVTIEAANMNRITVINAVGQVVYDREISAERTQLNIASLEAGIYMVRINTENGLVTKRLSVVR